MLPVVVGRKVAKLYCSLNLYPPSWFPRFQSDLTEGKCSAEPWIKAKFTVDKASLWPVLLMVFPEKVFKNLCYIYSFRLVSTLSQSLSPFQDFLWQLNYCFRFKITFKNTHSWKNTSPMWASTCTKCGGPPRWKESAILSMTWENGRDMNIPLQCEQIIF